MYDRFTDCARKVMQLANQEAMRFNHERLGTAHILSGMVKEDTCVAANVLNNLDIDLRKIRVEIEKIVQPGPDSSFVMGKLPQTDRVKRVIRLAIERASELNHNYVGTEHLLLGILAEGDGVACQILKNLGLTTDKIRDSVLALLSSMKPSEEDRSLDKPLISRKDVRSVLDQNVARIAAQIKSVSVPRHLGILRVNKDILATMLGLPKGSIIDAVTSEAYFAYDQIGIRFEHPALPVTMEGATIPEVQPLCHLKECAVVVDWNGNGMMHGTPPTIRPDAGKLAALLDRVSAEFCRVNGDAGLHSEMIAAIFELKGVTETAQDVPIYNSPNAVELGYIDNAGQFAPLKSASRIEGLSGTAGGYAFTDGVLEVHDGAHDPSGKTAALLRDKHAADANAALNAADNLRLITAPGEHQRCYVLDGTGQRCPNKARYWVGFTYDDYTYGCEEHLREVFRRGAAILDKQTGKWLTFQGFSPPQAAALKGERSVTDVDLPVDKLLCPGAADKPCEPADEKWTPGRKWL